jgi:hypothetical protein
MDRSAMWCYGIRRRRGLRGKRCGVESGRLDTITDGSEQGTIE